jgi:hypothetical protein
MNWKGFRRTQTWPSRGTNPVFAWGAEENHEKPQSGQPVSQMRFEPKTSTIQVYSVTARSSFSVERDGSGA